MPKAGETHEVRISRIEDKLEELDSALSEMLDGSKSTSVASSYNKEEIQTLNKAVRTMIDDFYLVKHDLEAHINKPDAHNVAFLARHGVTTVGQT